MMKGSTAPAAMLDTITYDITDAEIPESIPQWIKDKIGKSHEKSGTTASAQPVADPVAAPVEDDDAPPF